MIVSVGGMRLRHWTGYFRIIIPTLRMRRAAKADPRCLHADTFKEGDAFFAMSVWQDREAMADFANAGLHGALAPLAHRHMDFFHNHSFASDTIPSRKEARAIWDAAQSP